MMASYKATTPVPGYTILFVEAVRYVVLLQFEIVNATDHFK
jgi:hypothetical protein